MPFANQPEAGKIYNLEIRTDFKDGNEQELVYLPDESMCSRACPNRTASCGLVGLILRAESQESENMEVFGLVVGKQDDVEIRGEVWLERLVNPLTDDICIDFAPDGVEPSPATISEMLEETPESMATMHVADFIYVGSCLLKAAQEQSSSLLR